MNDQVKIYQDFIDELTELNEGVAAIWILEKEYPSVKENESINNLLKRLSKSDKEIIAQMVTDARIDGIHDTLVYLQDNINLEGLKIVRNDIDIANMPHGTTMHWDYVARSQGQEWPTEQLDEKYK